MGGGGQVRSGESRSQDGLGLPVRFPRLLFVFAVCRVAYSISAEEEEEVPREEFPRCLLLLLLEGSGPI